MATHRWKGVALPWGPTIKSFIEPKGDTEVLKTSVLFIIMTRKGERVMLPEFGSDVPNLLFEQNYEGLIGSIRSSVQAALAMWDDRVSLADVQVNVDEHTLHIKVLYKSVEDPKREVVGVLDIDLVPVAA